MKRKGGGRLTINDFLPDFAQEKKKPKDKEKDLKGFFIALSKNKPKE